MYKNLVETDNEVLIEIKNLHMYFHLIEGTVRAVNGVDLKIKRGRTLGIVGESGCGKSMTAYSILRIVPPPGRIEGGEILYYRPVNKDNSSTATEVIDLAKLHPTSKEIRAIRGNEISMVFQEPMTAMSPVRTVGAQIMEVIELHQKVSKAEARERAIEMLARVRMPNPKKTIDDYPFQLSGGMRQRAVIAMALSCHPRLLIADEPTTALDVTTEAQILDLMRELQQELGMAIMYITHNLGVIAEMANEVAVMYLGKVVEQATVTDLFFNPLHPYTRALLKSIPQLDDAVARNHKQKRLQVIKGMVPDPYSVLKGCSFHPRCPDFIAGVCNQVEPKYIEAEAGHFVRCHLYSQP
ncbi:MAG: ABC transporter ATP-binding protein [Anaerolineae bacterium]|nr:ABC transporter ATP-binding protein [Anaerolineae bacterium]MDW8100808.1 ABC transporter ATP-binding protein [Anaerolineae bacterium]